MVEKSISSLISFSLARSLIASMTSDFAMFFLSAFREILYAYPVIPHAGDGGAYSDRSTLSTPSMSTTGLISAQALRRMRFSVPAQSSTISSLL